MFFFPSVRVFLAWSILLSLRVGVCAAQSPAAGESDVRRPNLIFLLTDDQRWDTLGCMGNPIVQTPNLDRLSAQGVTFNNCFVTTSICMTNRTCIFTGQYARRHGNWSFSTSFTPEQLDQTYPGRLKAAGYYQGFIGKWGVGRPPDGFFDYNKGFPGQSYYEHEVNGTPIHLTRLMGNQAIEFLDGIPSDRPFCLSVSFKAPHVQDNDPRQFIPDPALMSLYENVTIPPPRLADPSFFNGLPEFLRVSENRARWERRFATPEMYQEMVKNYYRLISGVDAVVGRIREKLEEKGLAGNTVLVFSGDNGFYLGERGFAGKWYGHERSIRVPLIVHDPRLSSNLKGARRDETVLSIDIAPTLLDLAGAETPGRMQGRSLRPLVEGGRVPDWRTEFFYEHLFEHPKIPMSEGVRTRGWKYLRYVDQTPPYEELYDLTKDPEEATNLAGETANASVLDTMRNKWRTMREELK